MAVTPSIHKYKEMKTEWGKEKGRKKTKPYHKM